MIVKIPQEQKPRFSDLKGFELFPLHGKIQSRIAKGRSVGNIFAASGIKKVHEG